MYVTKNKIIHLIYKDKDCGTLTCIIFIHFQDTHRLYKQKLEEVTKLQDSFGSAISRQRKKLKELTASLKE